MQYNYYSLYNITENETSSENDRVQKMINKAQEAQNKHEKLVEHYEAEQDRLLKNINTHVKSGDTAKKKQAQAEYDKVHESWKHHRSQINDHGDNILKLLRGRDVAKAKKALRKTKIRDYHTKRKAGAVLAAGGFTAGGALLKSAHDDATE